MTQTTELTDSEVGERLATIINGWKWYVYDYENTDGRKTLARYFGLPMSTQAQRRFRIVAREWSGEESILNAGLSQSSRSFPSHDDTAFARAVIPALDARGLLADYLIVLDGMLDTPDPTGNVFRWASVVIKAPLVLRARAALSVLQTQDETR